MRFQMFSLAVVRRWRMDSGVFACAVFIVDDVSPTSAVPF